MPGAVEEGVAIGVAWSAEGSGESKLKTNDCWVMSDGTSERGVREGVLLAGVESVTFEVPGVEKRDDGSAERVGWECDEPRP